MSTTLLRTCEVVVKARVPSDEVGIRELAERVIERATKLGIRLAVAESLTGGLVAASLVSVPGASLAFTGAIVAYDTSLKASLLGVDSSLLQRVGPVDAQVARQMAAGARAACGEAEVGVATTGVAGPAADPPQVSADPPASAASAPRRDTPR